MKVFVNDVSNVPAYKNRDDKSDSYACQTRHVHEFPFFIFFIVHLPAERTKKILTWNFIESQENNNIFFYPNPADLDKSLFAGNIYAKRVDISATVTNNIHNAMRCR